MDEGARSSLRRLAQQLIATDIRYFELGARVEPVGGVRLAWMPSLADTPVGCVAVGAGPWPDRFAADEALEALERRVREVGGARVRLYLAREARPMSQALRARGYSPRFEIGLTLSQGREGAAPVVLEPVEDEAGWNRKRRLHIEAVDNPNGVDVAPDRWVEMERRKCGPEGLRPWLVRSGGVVAGTACTMEHEGLLRLKNVLVHPAHRRRGVASGMVVAFGAMATGQGRALALFAVADSPGERVYRGCGMDPVLRWVEWRGPPARTRSEET